jgi:hypothetical protein
MGGQPLQVRAVPVVGEGLTTGCASAKSECWDMRPNTLGLLIYAALGAVALLVVIAAYVVYGVLMPV